MQLKTMYPAQPNTPETTLAGALTTAGTNITVLDGAALPDPPNLLTIGADTSTAETVLMTEKNGNSLTVERGYNGTTPRAWTKGDIISVNNSCTLRLPEAGTWTVSATLNGYSATSTQTVKVVDSYAVALSFFKATISVTAPAGSTVTCTKGGVTYQQESGGTVSFVVMETGTWTLTATKDGETASNGRYFLLPGRV